MYNLLRVVGVTLLLVAVSIARVIDFGDFDWRKGEFIGGDNVDESGSLRSNGLDKENNNGMGNRGFNNGNNNSGRNNGNNNIGSNNGNNNGGSFNGNGNRGGFNGNGNGNGNMGGSNGNGNGQGNGRRIGVPPVRPGPSRFRPQPIHKTLPPTFKSTSLQPTTQSARTAFQSKTTFEPGTTRPTPDVTGFTEFSTEPIFVNTPDYDRYYNYKPFNWREFVKQFYNYRPTYPSWRDWRDYRYKYWNPEY